jgi:ribulose-5-phosphate 4-epimerase/fuculose-1-phosphate aldolase
MEKNIASAIGTVDDCNVLVLRNNGFACFAKSIDQAWLLAQRFEACCKLQLEVMKSGGEVHALTGKDIKQAVESGAAQSSVPTSAWSDLSASVMNA